MSVLVLLVARLLVPLCTVGQFGVLGRGIARGAAAEATPTSIGAVDDLPSGYFNIGAK